MRWEVHFKHFCHRSKRWWLSQEKALVLLMVSWTGKVFHGTSFFTWNNVVQLNDYADMGIWQTFCQEWTYHFESKAIIWKEIKSLYGVNDKLWGLKRKLDVLENLYQFPRQLLLYPIFQRLSRLYWWDW